MANVCLAEGKWGLVFKCTVRFKHNIKITFSPPSKKKLSSKVYELIIFSKYHPPRFTSLTLRISFGIRGVLPVKFVVWESLKSFPPTVTSECNKRWRWGRQQLFIFSHHQKEKNKQQADNMCLTQHHSVNRHTFKLFKFQQNCNHHHKMKLHTGDKKLSYTNMKNPCNDTWRDNVWWPTKLMFVFYFRFKMDWQILFYLWP